MVSLLNKAMSTVSDFIYGEEKFLKAAQEGDVATVEKFLKKIDPRKARITHSPHYSEDALELACNHSHINVVKVLLNDERVREYMLSKESEKNPILSHMLWKEGSTTHLKITEMLLAAGAHLEIDGCCRWNENQPIISAVCFENLEGLKLMKQRAQVIEKLMYAFLARLVNPDPANIVISYVDRRFCPLTIDAALSEAMHCYLEKVKLHSHIFKFDYVKFQPKILEIVKFLLDEGADPLTRDSYKRQSILEAAASNGTPPHVISLLLDKVKQAQEKQKNQ